MRSSVVVSLCLGSLVSGVCCSGGGNDDADASSDLAPFACDENTLRLYHFDDSLESDCQTGTLEGNGAFVAGQTGFGKAFAGAAVADPTLSMLARPVSIDLTFLPNFPIESGVLVAIAGDDERQLQIEYADNGISLVSFGVGCDSAAPSASIFLGPALQRGLTYQVTASLSTDEASFSVRRGASETERVTQALCDMPTGAQLIVGGDVVGAAAHAQIDELRIRTIATP